MTVGQVVYKRVPGEAPKLPRGGKKGKKSSGIQGRPQQEGGQSQSRILESVFKKKKQRKGAELCAAQLRAPGSLCSSIVRGSAD